MADGSSSKNRENDSDASEESENPAAPHLQLDLGDDLSHNVDNFRLGTEASGSEFCPNDAPKREDNPFSFKHFLRNSDTNNYQSKGARPKIYCNQSSMDKNKNSTRKPTEFSSALPDFVQDHLVIEQCYLSNSPNSGYNVDVNQLPDFAPTSRQTTKRSNFNLNQQSAVDEPTISIPLDLPGPSHSGFPLDLPVASVTTSARNGPTLAEVGNSKSLPDFLADSAVCSQKSDPVSTSNSPEGDSERIRRELEIVRRQLSEKTRYCDSLRRELEVAKTKEQEYTQNLARALQQVEDNLEKSNRRADIADSTVLKLRQEIKMLKQELNHTKMDNMNNLDEAAGGHDYYHNSTTDLHSQRLAQELRTAASTAEHSLRQLLTGVDNLRIMASTLENMHRIEERNDPFSKFDEGAGPAL